MKITHIVLTATILLSLKSTLFCSSEELHESIKIERKNSFDALRDRGGYAKGFFSSFIGYTNKDLVAYTYQHWGKIYNGKEIRPGSSQESIAAWDQEINTVQDAQNFIVALSKNSDVISTDHPIRKKAIDIIRQSTLISCTTTADSNAIIQEHGEEKINEQPSEHKPNNKRWKNRPTRRNNNKNTIL
ncbi:MAG: hypothetical protein Q8Q60_05055 [Candidatus Chromulinivorax sp.]|nr:hypothetical protein [Candidatus Chromulinivorax sp.]